MFYIFIDITSYTCSRLRTVICVHVYSSVSEFIIVNISLDKPGFGVWTTDAKVHFSDPPRSSGSSSTTSGDSTRRSCTKCHGRMSSFSLDKHLFCTKCRGSECSMNSRCDECMQWTEEDMLKYVKLRKSLSSKSKRSNLLLLGPSPMIVARTISFQLSWTQFKAN